MVAPLLHVLPSVSIDVESRGGAARLEEVEEESVGWLEELEGGSRG